jgi:hypothetical protein
MDRSRVMQAVMKYQLAGEREPRTDIAETSGLFYSDRNGPHETTIIIIIIIIIIINCSIYAFIGL